MADSKISVEILQKPLEKGRVLNEQIAAAGGYNSKQGQIAQAKASGLWQVIEKLIQKIDLTETEFDQLAKATKDFFSILETYSTRIADLSEETKKAQEALKTATANKNKIDKDVNKKELEVAKNRKALADKYQNVELHKITKSGELSKQSLTDWDTITKNFQSGTKIGYRDASGNIVEINNAEALKLANTYTESAKELEELKAAAKAAAEALSNAKTAFKTSYSKDQEVNKKQGTALVEVAEASAAADEGIKTGYSQFTKKTVEKIESQTPGPKYTENIKKKEPSGFGKLAKQFTLYAVAMRAAKSAIREAVGTIKELDKSLTEQAMVTGKTRQETYELVGQYQELAKATASTTKEVAQVATEYMKQGKSTKEALVLTEAAISAAKVARVSVGDSVNYLTTALNGFRLSADQAMAVSDKFAAVAASSATDYDELAIALSKVASQANLAGMSIDYTTALLTKGLETTREAPETMGTALKTVIARMREIKDYGETLQGDTDINNVESQLAVVGIALRNQQGELRSTQDVLDELGKKWDTLNKNQQAAIAKALAGTRQQSRLIAMMDGYERVTELQQISERSAGATMTQMGTHLEGMEAALNRVQVAWESIVTALTNSDFLIGLIDKAANLLDWIGNLLDNDFILISTLSTVFIAIGVHLANHYELQKMQNKAVLEGLVDKQKEALLEKQQEVAEKRNLILKLKWVKAQRQGTQYAAANALLDKDKTNDAQAAAFLAEAKLDADASDAAINTQIHQLKTEVAAGEAEILRTKIGIAETGVQIAGNEAGIVGTLGKGLQILTPILGIMTLLAPLIGRITAARKKDIIATKGQEVAENKLNVAKGKGFFLGMVNVMHTKTGKVLAAAAAIATLAAIGVGIAASLGAFEDKEDKAAKEINEMSNEIYKLNEKANALNEVGRKFDDIDKKVIKTSKDMKDMNSLLDSAADKLSEEEKAQFQTLGSPQAKAQYLEQIEQKARNDARDKQREQLEKIKEHPDLLTSDDPEAIKVQAAVKAAANAQLYDDIDKRTNLTKEEAYATEQLTHAILDQLDAKQALAYADSPEKMRQLVDATQKHAAALQDESASLKERTQAYLDMRAALSGDAKVAFEQAYSQWNFFATMSDAALDFIDNAHLSIDTINELYNGADTFNKKLEAAYDKMREENKDFDGQPILLNTREYQDALTGTFESLNDDFSNFTEVLEDNFGSLIDITDKNGAEWTALVETIADQFSTSILDMGQKMAKFKNTISSFYETAGKWAEMSDDKKAEFISENAELFEGTEGDKLLEALNNNDYERMEKALNSDKMQKRRQEMLDEVTRNLNMQLALAPEQQNKAYIQQLQEHKKFLEDVDNLYKVSIKTRLEQQEKQLSEYKNMLQKEHDALTKSLEKRKEAYQKYFDTINQEQDEEDYEEQANLLISNISKLGSDSTGSAANQRADLEKQLQELEKERLEELRQHAQEKVMENLDKEVEEINEKFDKLIDSNHELLLAMQNDLGTTEGKAQLFTDLLNTKLASGASRLEMQTYLKDLQGSFGGQFTGLWDKLDIKERNGDLFLNVNGQEILLNQNDQQSVYDAIIQALRAIGK